jgi:hypothetical protein
MLATFGSESRFRAARALAVLVLIPIAAGCSGGGAAGGDGLSSALGHVADTAGNRGQVYYDDTATLVRLTGPTPDYSKGFAVLLGLGTSSIAATIPVLSGDTGIEVFKENFAITAGSPPAALTLLDGGQDASLVTSRLTRLGWKQDGGTLVGPSISGGSGDAPDYALPMHEVRPGGADVVFGGQGADLAQAGSPSGSTLASDPMVSALASCLGDVVAAEIFVGSLSGTPAAAVAVGVRTPSSDTATPRAVACTAWPSQSAAARYASAARTALASGRSARTNEPYSVLLKNPVVTSLGGGQNVVQWQADTPGRADVIFQMIEEQDLPPSSRA